MLPQRPQTDINLPLDIAYADDVDFVSHSRAFLSQVGSIAPSCLRHWFLFVNQSKTEEDLHETNHVAEGWRVTKKLGSLLGGCRRCGSQETAGSAGIPPDVDTVAVTTTC